MDAEKIIAAFQPLISRLSRQYLPSMTSLAFDQEDVEQELRLDEEKTGQLEASLSGALGQIAGAFNQLVERVLRLEAANSQVTLDRSLVEGLIRQATAKGETGE